MSTICYFIIFTIMVLTLYYFATCNATIEYFQSPKNPQLLVVMYTDRNLPFERMTAKINEWYCKKHGYEFMFLTSSKYDTLIPPWWRKIFIIRDVLYAKKDIRYIMWVDSDAAFVKDAPPIHELFDVDKDKAFFVGDDYSLKVKNYAEKHGTSNAGVFAIPNNEKGKAFLAKWLKMYDPRKWCDSTIETSCDKPYSYGKWKTDGGWSEDTFEQGAMNILIYENADQVKSYHEDYMSGHHGGKYINHLWSATTLEREKFFEKELEKIL